MQMLVFLWHLQGYSMIFRTRNVECLSWVSTPPTSNLLCFVNKWWAPGRCLASQVASSLHVWVLLFRRVCRVVASSCAAYVCVVCARVLLCY
jgi:hypothetical protein